MRERPEKDASLCGNSPARCHLPFFSLRRLEGRAKPGLRLYQRQNGCTWACLELGPAQLGVRIMR
jgi:hypothetical protein